MNRKQDFLIYQNEKIIEQQTQYNISVCSNFNLIENSEENRVHFDPIYHNSDEEEYQQWCKYKKVLKIICIYIFLKKID